MTTSVNIDYAKVAMKLASLLGRKYNVNILFGGNEAKTDGDTIYLPHWDFHDPRKRNALYGLIFHEAAGHVRNTDFDALQRVARARRNTQAKVPDELWHAASNILEDIRIERAGLLQYPGAKSLLNSVCELVFEDYPRAEDQDNHWTLALNWSILTFRSRILGQTVLKHLSESYTAVARQQFGDDVLSSAITIAQEAAIARDTVAVLQLAERLVALFDDALPPEQKPEQPPQPQQQPTGSQGHDGQQGGSDGSQGQDGQQGGSDGSQGQDGQQGSSDGSQGQDGQQGSSDGAGGGASGSGQASTVAKPLSKALPDKANLARYDVAQSLARKAKAPDGGPAHEVGYVQPNVGSDVAGGGRIDLDDVSSELRQAVTLRQGIVGAVSPMLCGDAEYSEPRRSGRALDPRQLTRVKTDPDPKVWRTLQIEDDQSVAVQILIDTSSSTRQNNILEEERKSALSLASALEQYPLVETAISHFPADSNLGRDLAPLLKPFDRPVSLCLKGWPRAKGGTPLGAAYRASAFNFFLSDKERKILFVMTDGKPDNEAQASTARLWLKQMGVEVYGVVIGQKTFPAEIFDDAILIQTASELPRAIMELVKRHV